MARKSSGKADAAERIAAGERLAAGAERPVKGTAAGRKGARKPRAIAGQPVSRSSRGGHASGDAVVTPPVAPTGPAPGSTRRLVEQAEAAGAAVTRARWRDVLGDDLAGSVALACAAAGEDPADWCRRQLADAVGVLERRVARRGATASARSRCPHPDRDRRGMRCGACGERGLPAT